jgi:hypothetical protein
MALGLMISALVANPDKALTVLPVVLLAQFLLSGALFNVASNPVLRPVSYVTSARWGFAAAASTVDLRAMPSPVGCPSDNGSRSERASTSGPNCDAAREHTAGRWLADMTGVLLLTVLALLIAWGFVRRIGRPRRQ